MTLILVSLTLVIDKYLRQIEVYDIGDMIKVKRDDEELIGKVVDVDDDGAYVHFHTRSEYSQYVYNDDIIEKMSPLTILWNEPAIPEGTKVIMRGNVYTIEYDDHSIGAHRFKLNRISNGVVTWGTLGNIEIVKYKFNIGDKVDVKAGYGAPDGTGEVVRTGSSDCYNVRYNDYDWCVSGDQLSLSKPMETRELKIDDIVEFDTFIKGTGVITVIDKNGCFIRPHDKIAGYETIYSSNSCITKLEKPLNVTFADWEFRTIPFDDGEAIEVYNSRTKLVAATFIDESNGWFRLGNQTGNERKTIFTSDQKKYQK
jgi:hypothetical protein